MRPFRSLGVRAAIGEAVPVLSPSAISATIVVANKTTDRRRAQTARPWVLDAGITPPLFLQLQGYDAPPERSTDSETAHSSAAASAPGRSGSVAICGKGDTTGHRLICPSWEQASHNGELAHAIEAGMLGQDDVTDLGTVLAGAAPGRASDEDVTAFDSTGLAIQDLAIALAAMERAEALDLPLFDL
jgi:ornithine cyclodeaminase/alanine dehydrogenase-like protein (mu-crystallin family)